MRFSSEDELLQWARAAQRLWLFLDYDGTLEGFSPVLNQVQPNQEVIDLVSQLAESPFLRLAVISGRRLEELEILLPVPGIFLAGVYGAEIQTPAKERVNRLDYPSLRPPLDLIKPRWEKLISKHREVFLEDKGWTLALHGSQGKGPSPERVLRSARRLALESLPLDRFRILAGRTYLEVAPLQAHKGETVSFLLQHYPSPVTRVLYVGDDDKDLEAFETVHAIGGLAVLVSDPASPHVYPDVDYLLGSPQDVRRWLRGLLLPGG
jgi:trehalose 6-phosphate phosphatase